MAAPTVLQLVAPSITILVDTPVLVGDLIGWNSTDSTWTKADADIASRYAQWVCVEDSVNSGALHTTKVSKEVFINDLDAPFTANGIWYLSSTAGEGTATRPVATSTSRLVQVIGHGVSTFVMHYKLPIVHEQSDYQQFGALSSLNEAAVVLDSGNFASISYDADNDDAYLTARVPDKAVSLAAAYLYYGIEAEVSTITLAITVGSALHDAQHDAVTQDATLTALDLAAAIDADDIGKSDISTNFDATNIIRPGALLGVHINVDLGGTDVTHLYGIEFIWQVVD